MPATDQQARAIAFLAAQMRPIDAPNWDQVGVVAKITADQRDLPDIALDAIACALDPEARTPGAIGKRPWRTRLLAVPTTGARPPRKDECCLTCGRFVDVCAATGCDKPTTKALPIAAPETRQQYADKIRAANGWPTTGGHA